MRINQRIMAVAAAAVALGLSAGVASAQDQLKLDQVGAALAFPLIGGHSILWQDDATPANGGGTTYITITNVGPVTRNLHFNVISGDGWEVTDFDCPVTASETVLIHWRPDGPFSYELYMECNFGGVAFGKTVSRSFNWSQGVLFVSEETHECKDGSCTTNENDLFGDFVVVDAAQGSAYSAGAVPFQGKDPLADGVADRDYKFDNTEYAMFPATLATNFIAPGPNPVLGQFVTAELILFVLDGRANIGSQAALDIVFYDDEETPTSAHYTFDCFTIVPLERINPNFNANLLGSSAGHLYMTAIDADQASNVHDNKFGNGNRIRVVGVHGWLVQGIGGVVKAVEECVEADEVCINQGSSWSRTMAQGMLPQDLDGNDVPAFDGL